MRSPCYATCALMGQGNVFNIMRKIIKRLPQIYGDDGHHKVKILLIRPERGGREESACLYDNVGTGIFTVFCLFMEKRRSASG